MSREFLEYCPTTGMAEFVEWNTDGTFNITSEQDVEPYIDFAKEMANSAIPDGNFRKEGWLYAIIPPVVQAQMFKRGINILDKNDSKKVVDTINADYPWLKTTHRHHAL